MKVLLVQVVILCHDSFSVDNEAAQKHFREEKLWSDSDFRKVTVDIEVMEEG